MECFVLGRSGEDSIVAASLAALRTEGRQYDATVLAPRRARSFVDDFLARSRWNGSRADVALITSELVADALRQSPTSIVLRIELNGDALRTEVSDDPALIHDGSAGRFERSVARRLVEELASNWGSDLERGRTTTWFSMRVDDHQDHAAR
jgi:hypothetical protein